MSIIKLYIVPNPELVDQQKNLEENKRLGLIAIIGGGRKGNNGVEEVMVHLHCQLLH